MPLVFPISYLTNSVKSILSLFLNEVSVISHLPSFETHNELKVISHFPDELLPDLNNINLTFSNVDLDNIKDVALPDVVQTVFSIEEVKKIKEKITRLQNANNEFDLNSILTLYRLFLEYDKGIDETNRQYEFFLKKFKLFQEILNSHQETLTQEDSLSFSFEELNLIKPNLRLKTWLFLFRKLNKSFDVLIGISKDVSETIIDQYFIHTKNMPRLILSLNCEGISYQNLKHRDHILNLFNEIIKEKSDPNSLNSNINKLQIKWEELYKPKRDSVVKINFYDFSEIPIVTLLSNFINMPIDITTSNSIHIFIE